MVLILSMKVFTNGSTRLVLGASMHAKLMADRVRVRVRWARTVINLGKTVVKQVKGDSQLHIADGHDQMSKLEA